MMQDLRCFSYTGFILDGLNALTGMPLPQASSSNGWVRGKSGRHLRMLRFSQFDPKLPLERQGKLILCINGENES
jgi:hypothetical protein